MITQTVIPDEMLTKNRDVVAEIAEKRSIAEKLGIEEQIGNMRRELRELAAKIDRLEKHQHGTVIWYFD